MEKPNAYMQLRAQLLAASTRPFLARGISVNRCARCQLSQSTCICSWRVECQAQVEVVVLMHHDEIFKPTNTGRLIADILPKNTRCFEWSRTQPAQELLDMLADPQRYWLTLFPSDRNDKVVHESRDTLPRDRQLTLLLLDGTWRQASRMLRSSHWLKNLPQLNLPANAQGHYRIRQALQDGQLSTAEAAAMALQICGEHLAADVLFDYFHVFHQHYIAIRRTQSAQTDSDSHLRLQRRIQS